MLFPTGSSKDPIYLCAERGGRDAVPFTGNSGLNRMDTNTTWLTVFKSDSQQIITTFRYFVGKTMYRLSRRFK